MKSKDSKKSIILLSGGLDSVVALGASLEEYNVDLALTFDYGQKAAAQEIEASQKVAEYYGVKHKIIRLDWLKDITNTALVSNDYEIPSDNFGTSESASSVWVPNRNGLFLNIAASYADALGYNYIIFGANRDEGKTFPDNTEEFRSQITKLFESSTLIKPKVLAPLINYSKGDIVRIAVEKLVPLELIRSCYGSDKRHCGKCESCMHLKRALAENNCKDYIDILFGKE